MDWQQVFYIVATVFMVLLIVTVVSMAVALWKIYASINKLKKEAQARVKSLLELKKTELGTAALGVATSFVAKRIKKIFRRK